MMVIKKRQVVLVALIVMILVAGYLNWSYQKEMEAIPTMGDDIDTASKKNIGEAQMVNSEVDSEDQTVSEHNQQIVVNTDTTSAYFIEARMDKESTRSEAIEILQEIVDNEKSPQESRGTAQEEMIEIAKNMDQEVVIENLIKAKGFEHVVVFINEGKVNIVVGTSGLIPSQVAQITDIVVSQTGVSIDNIKIMEKQ